MPPLMPAPPFTAVEPVLDVMHGVWITDPYRWLEDQNSPQTRDWIEEQTRYARAYLDNIPGRERIRERVRELLDVETYDSFLKARNRYFFRKRRPGQEQPSIYFREGAEGEDQLLIDPASRGTGDYTSVRPLRISPDGSLVLYEVKQGGERMARFEVLDLATRRRLPDALPKGYLRGFAFAPDSKSFYYVHENGDTARPSRCAAFCHVIGTDFRTDREIFRTSDDPTYRLVLISGISTLGFLVYRFRERTYTDFYIQGMESSGCAIPILKNANYQFLPRLAPGRILAQIDKDAPNHRIVELQARKNQSPIYWDLVHETSVPIHQWAVTSNHILVSYLRHGHPQIKVFDRFGQNVGNVPCDQNETVRFGFCSFDSDEVLLERESFTHPIEILRCSIPTAEMSNLAARPVSPDSAQWSCNEVRFPSKDGTAIPLFLVAQKDFIAQGTHPTIMTSYGGFGVPVTPKFSVLISLLINRGFVFALPNIRGGSGPGPNWHNAAKRQARQTAFDDFLAAAEWLITTARTTSDRLAIFGGSNSGLLVAAAATQRPDLFRAVLCIAPLTDMLRFHLFNGAHVWKDEYGTSEDAGDFQALQGYSPYHAIREGTPYPAIMVVSGDADQNCNPMHARKMIARLQAANVSQHPVLLEYSPQRGHSPVLPLSIRIDALTDRTAFLCEQCGVRA